MDGSQGAIIGPMSGNNGAWATLVITKLIKAKATKTSKPQGKIVGQSNLNQSNCWLKNEDILEGNKGTETIVVFLL
jgi:hypothetical protein